MTLSLRPWFASDLDLAPVSPFGPRTSSMLHRVSLGTEDSPRLAGHFYLPLLDPYTFTPQDSASRS